MHVDACLGGFINPFGKEAGFDLPIVDFQHPGVTSISCDTHKYGYAAKGSSIVMFRKAEMRRFAIFSCSEWSGGVYASATYAGSRPGLVTQSLSFKLRCLLWSITPVIDYFFES